MYCGCKPGDPYVLEAIVPSSMATTHLARRTSIPRILCLALHANRAMRAPEEVLLAMARTPTCQFGSQPREHTLVCSA
jgi:hypothetical protein